MGWIARRVVGAVIFACVVAILGAYAVTAGYITGEPTLSTACGLLIFGIAFGASLGFTTYMKHRDKVREAWAQYYARTYPQYYQRR